MIGDQTPNISTTNPAYGGSLFETLLYNSRTARGIADLKRSRGREFYHYITALAGGASTATNAPNGLYTKKIKPYKVRVGQVLTRTDNGNGTLTLALTDSTIEFFRNKETVVDGGASHKVGQVFQSSPGTITISTTPGGDAFVSTDFAVGEYVTAGWYNNGTEWNTPGVSLSTQKEMRNDYAAWQREDWQQSTNEKQLRMTLGGFWYSYTEKEQEAYDRLFEGYGKKCWFSEVGEGMTFTGEGKSTSTRGIVQSIRQDGLEIVNTAAISLQDLEDAINFASQTLGQYSMDITMNLSNQMKMYINNAFGADFIRYTGTTNTVGGAQVLGNDISLLQFGGITMKFMQWAFLNDGAEFPSPSNIAGYNGSKLQHTAFLGNWSPIPAYGDGATSMPVIERIHMANEDGESWGNPVHNMIKGMTPKQLEVSIPTPGETHSIAWYNGISMIADSFVLFSPAS